MKFTFSEIGLAVGDISGILSRIGSQRSLAEYVDVSWSGGYVANGDPENPEHGWLVCLRCAQRMDRDPAFKAGKRAAFEEYQRHLKGVRVLGES